MSEVSLPEQLAERCRRELDDMNYYEGTLRRDNCILRHIQEAVEEAVAAERHRHALELEIRRRESYAAGWRDACRRGADWLQRSALASPDTIP